MMSDAAARPILRSAWFSLVDRKPPLAALQIAQGIARFEGNYGAWKGRHNWGAVMCSVRPVNGVCPAGCGFSNDSFPDGRPMPSCFKEYPDDFAGARDFLRHLTILRPSVLVALRTGNIDAVAEAMFREHYYTGFGKTEDQRINGYAATIDNNVRMLAGTMGEAVAAHRGATTRETPEHDGNPLPFLALGAVLLRFAA